MASVNPGFSVSIHGIEGLVANLYSMDRAVQRNVRSAIKRLAEDTVKLARDLAPEDTGLLRSSIRYTLSKGGLAYTIDCNPSVFAKAGKDDYSPHVEHGTIYSPAQPFLAPAFREIEPLFRAELRDAILSGISRLR